MPWRMSMVPIVGVALKVQEPYVPGFPFPLVSVTVTRRLGMLFSVAGWNLTPAVSARALPAPKHKTPGAAAAATPSAKTTRFFVGLQIFTLRVLSPVAVPPTVCRPQRAFWGLCPGSSQAHHMNGELLTVTEVAAMTRLSEGTLRYWRSVEAGGAESFTLGRRVMHRRVDVEKWLAEAR
jgi:hypothetical protein